MATAKPTRQHRGPGRWRRPALIVAVLAAAIVLLFGAQIGSSASAGAAVGARVACSCRFVGGRDLADCRKDFEPGMWAVVLSEDEEARSVTARVPLLASQTATYRSDQGCRLEAWSD